MFSFLRQYGETAAKDFQLGISQMNDDDALFDHPPP